MHHSFEMLFVRKRLITYKIHTDIQTWAGPDLVGARRARAPGLPPTGGLPQNPSIFWLMIDVSLVILIEDFEINEN